METEGLAEVIGTLDDEIRQLMSELEADENYRNGNPPSEYTLYLERMLTEARRRLDGTLRANQ